MAKGSDTIMLLGAAAVAYYGYTQGWFSGILGKLGGGAPAPATPAAAPAPAPTLGSKVGTVAQIAAQAAANDAYILPDWTMLPSASTPAPSGYSQFVLTDYPQGVFLRQDVDILANQIVGSSGPIALADLQKAMTAKGLSGLGDFQRYIVTRTGRIRPVRVA